jgi:hypothetical protein
MVLIIIGLAIAVVAFVIIEGKRQERVYGKGSGRPNLMGAGLLELQQHLQPDRKVEMLQMQQKEEEVAEMERDESGDPPQRD